MRCNKSASIALLNYFVFINTIIGYKKIVLANCIFE